MSRQPPAYPPKPHGQPQQPDSVHPPHYASNTPMQQASVHVTVLHTLLNIYICVQLPIQIVLDDHPQCITCPKCNAQVTTEVKYVNGGLTWIIFGVMLCAGLVVRQEK